MPGVQITAKIATNTNITFGFAINPNTVPNSVIANAYNAGIITIPTPNNINVFNNPFITFYTSFFINN